MGIVAVELTKQGQGKRGLEPLRVLAATAVPVAQQVQPWVR